MDYSIYDDNDERLHAGDTVLVNDWFKTVIFIDGNGQISIVWWDWGSDFFFNREVSGLAR